MILLRMTLVCCFIDQRHDRVDRIHLVAAAHGFYVFLAVEVKLVYFIHQQIRRNIILVQHNGIALRLEGSSIQQLVSAAAGSRQGNQDIGFFSARSSQMALAPAREITTSAMAKMSFNSDLIYSNCLYPGVFNSRLSILSLPQRWTT